MDVTTSDIRKVALASLIGSTLEWYDFFIFGAAAALVFNTLFYPSYDATTGMIASLATFAVGFVARPIGGIVFGHFGDRLGRKAMLVLSLTMMGGITFLIGLLPTYGSVGIAAPILLTALRFLQGFAVGGEWGGASLMVVETSPAARRGYFGSWPQMGIPAALLLSSGVMALVTWCTSPAEFTAWGWRVPFLLSGLLLIAGIVIRRRVAESPSFQRMRQAGARQSMPIAVVAARRKRVTGLLIGAQAAENTSFYVFSVYTLAYLTGVMHLPRATALNALMVAAAANLITQPLFGALSDRIGRKRVYAGGMAFIGLFVVPYFLMIGTGNIGIISLAMVLGLVLGQAPTQATQPSFCAEQYEAPIRYSGVSLAYQFATVLWSGPTPILAASLFAWSGSWVPLAIYIVAAAVLSVACIAPLREAAGGALSSPGAAADDLAVAPLRRHAA